MPEKKKPEDWRMQLKGMGQLPEKSRGFGPGARGYTILARDTRKSIGNEGLPNEDVMQILEQMQGNLTWRGHNASAEMKKRLEAAKKRSGGKTVKERLKGLFGGG
jgi:hypothetical protein